MSIATEITRLQNAKTNIKNAIIAKGVAVDDNLTLDAYANLIAGISGGEVTMLDALNRCSGNVRRYDAYSINYGEINTSYVGLLNAGTDEEPIYIMSDGSFISADEPMRIFEGTISLKPNNEVLTNVTPLFTLDGNTFSVNVKEYYQGDAQVEAIGVYNNIAGSAEGIAAPSYLGSWKQLEVRDVDEIINWTNFDISSYGYKEALMFVNWHDNNGTSNDLVVSKSGDKYRFLTNNETSNLNSLELYKYDSSTMTIEAYYPNKTYSANGSWNINTNGENRGRWTITNDSINIGSSSVNITRYYEDDMTIELRTEVSSDLGGYIKLGYDKGDGRLKGEIYSESGDYISNIEGTRITE